jgi:hypothetical protein
LTLLVEFAAADAQPAEGDVAVLEGGEEREVDLVPVGVELLQRDEQVHVVGALRRHPEAELAVARDLGVFVARMVPTGSWLPA